jgi:hypothetical protein
MKNLRNLSLFLALLVGFLQVAEAQSGKGAVIAVDREIHNFGKMLPDQIPDGKISFTVYNNGDEPLILSNVRACCGTRVDEYTNTPIFAGDSGMVVVSWRIHNRPHQINRTVTITSNATNRQTYILRIRGEVVLPEE